MVYTTPKSQATTISNQSAISDSFKESLGMRTSPESITGPAPVQYATSRNAVRSSASVGANRAANRAYNELASQFDGVNTSYGRDMSGQSYSTPGRFIDVMA